MFVILLNAAATGTTASTSVLNAAVPAVPGAGSSVPGAGSGGGAGAGAGAGGAATTTTTKKPTTTTMKITTTTKKPVLANTTVTPCASGWKHHGHSCYKFVTTTVIFQINHNYVYTWNLLIENLGWSKL